MRKIWTKEEIEYLKSNYPNNTSASIAEYLGRKLCSVYSKAFSFGLSKSEAFLKSEASGRLTALSASGYNYRYKKGQKAFNKGKKQTDYMSAESIESTKATRFKKGNIPGNIKPLGYERITVDGYIEKKIKEPNIFIFKHRHEWEKVNGNIPLGMILICKTKDKTNCNPNNWMMINREKNMELNTIHNYPPEIIKTIKLTNRILKITNKKKS